MKRFVLGIAAYVGAALACHAMPQERLYGGTLMAPLQHDVTSRGGTQFVGRTTLNSGTASVTVSTAMVKSDSWIGGQWIPNAATASGASVTPAPMSIVDGVSFAIANPDGAGRAPGGTFCWEIRRTK
jgi:hypothetical protein